MRWSTRPGCKRKCRRTWTTASERLMPGAQDANTRKRNETIFQSRNGLFGMGILVAGVFGVPASAVCLDAMD